MLTEDSLSDPGDDPCAEVKGRWVVPQTPRPFLVVLPAKPLPCGWGGRGCEEGVAHLPNPAVNGGSSF